jgi:hypothetical protein
MPGVVAVYNKAVPGLRRLQCRVVVVVARLCWEVVGPLLGTENTYG